MEEDLHRVLDDDFERSDGVVRLRRPTPADAPAQTEAVRASLPELSVYMSWATADYNVADSLSWINGEHNPLEVPLLAVEVQPGGAGGPGSDVVLGALGLAQFDWANQACELGYWIRSDRAGQGIGYRAAALACRIAFEDLGLHRVEMLILPQNSPSRRLAEKLGAVHEGQRRERVHFQGEPADCEAYAVLATDPEWV